MMLQCLQCVSSPESNWFSVQQPGQGTHARTVRTRLQSTDQAWPPPYLPLSDLEWPGLALLTPLTPILTQKSPNLPPSLAQSSTTFVMMKSLLIIHPSRSNILYD